MAARTSKMTTHTSTWRNEVRDAIHSRMRTTPQQFKQPRFTRTKQQRSRPAVAAAGQQQQYRRVPGNGRRTAPLQILRCRSDERREDWANGARSITQRHGAAEKYGQYGSLGDARARARKAQSCGADGDEQPADEAACYHLIGRSLWDEVCEQPAADEAAGACDDKLIWGGDGGWAAGAHSGSGEAASNDALVAAAASLLPPLLAPTAAPTPVPRAADLEDEADACHTRRWDRWAARRAMLGVGEDDE